MKRLARIALSTLLTWTVSSVCTPDRLVLYDLYVNGPGFGDHVEGWYPLPPTQTQFTLAPGKPVIDCAVGWRAPVAVDAQGRTLPPECQPIGFRVDGRTWEGI